VQIRNVPPEWGQTEGFGKRLGVPSMSWGIIVGKFLAFTVRSFFCVLLVCGACSLLSVPTLGQENQGTTKPSPSTSSQVRTGSSNTTDQTAQPSAPAQSETQPKEKSKKKRSKLDGLVVAPLLLATP